MPIVDIFYQLESGSQIVFGENPTGSLAVDRLMQGQKNYWISPTLQRERKPKKLILSDWTAQNWSDEKIMAVQKALGELINIGFALYIDKSGQIKPLLKEELSCLQDKKTREAMEPSYPAEVYAAAMKQQRLTRDEIQILDDYWLQALLNNEDIPQERYVSVNDFSGLSQEQRVKLVEIIKHSEQSLQYILSDIRGADYLNRLADLKLAFPNVKQTVKYHTAILDNSGLESLLNLQKSNDYNSISELNDLKNVKTIVLNSIKHMDDAMKSTTDIFSISSFKQVEKVNILKCKISLQQLVGDTLNLKSIKLYYDVTEEPEVSVEFKLTPKGIEKIDVIDARINSSHLKQLLNPKTNNLEYVKHQQSNFKFPTLTELEAIDLSGAFIGRINMRSQQISHINLQSLLNDAPKLKKIDLTDCNLLETDVKFELHSRNTLELEEVCLAGTNLNPANLQNLLDTAPKLKKIRLNRCKLLLDNFEFKFPSLKMLEEIDLSGTNISPINLQSLLLTAPNLKKINLTNCNLLLDNFKFQIPFLKRLEEIDLSDTNISPINLQSLLYAASNLKKINLTNCKLLQANIEFKFPFLKTLEEIDLSGTDISPINLKSLLRAAPNLKKIRLTDCNLLQANFEFKLPPLNTLEEIILSFTNLSEAYYQNLMDAAPKLKHICLEGCNLLQANLNVNFNFKFKLPPLNELEKISLGSTKMINLINMQKLLNTAPKLQEISLRNCNNLATYFEFKLHTLNDLKKIDLSFTDISPNNLLQLMKAFPKLREIKLHRCNQLQENFKFKLPSLNHLKLIYVNESNISLANLEQLVKVACNLKTILIYKCFTESQKNALQEKYPHLNIINFDITMPNHVTISVDSNHNPNRFKEYKPTPKEEIFEFRGQNKTKNQGMIIEKFCQYLTLTQQNIHLIPEVRDGICNALAHLYGDYSPQEWGDFITITSNWDGKNTTIMNSLTSHFNTLQTYIHKYQLNPTKNSPQQYLGDNLNGFLNHLKEECILTNPWHAIAVKPIKFSKHWMVYDPNYVDGAREVSQGQILKTIQNAIGSIVSMESYNQQDPAILDQAIFIEKGGLLALTKCKNASQMLDAIQKKFNYSSPALEGLLLRATDAEPAWSIGLRHSNPRIATLTNQLLQQFHEKNPNAKQALQKSMEAMAPQQKQECITHLIQQVDKSLEKASDLQDSLIEIIRTPITKDYQRVLQTWKKQSTLTNSFLEYAQQCMRPDKIKKRLIELDSVAQVDAMRFGLQHYCMDTKRPVFYVHCPEELVCKAPFVQRGKNGQGHLKKGPGGPLYDFLQANHQEQAPVLLVNYSEFHADDMVRLNALLDKERQVDNTKVPKNALIIGLINSKNPDCYQGSDFYSRFDKVEKSPLTITQLEKQQVVLPILEASEQAYDKQAINLFHSPNWEAQLLGHWALDGESLSFQEGLLVEALTHGSSLEIQNGPWENEAFKRFWQQACLQGFISHAGRTITIPPGLQLIQNEGYDWNALKSFFSLVDTKPDEKNTEQVLNPYCFNDFLNRYLCDDQRLHRQGGFVASTKENTLPVYLTRTLGEDQWAMLLSECQRHQVQLQVRCAPGINLPKALSPSHNPTINIGDIKQHTQIITSSDVDTTVAQLTQEQNNWQLIDVSECNPSQLLNSFQGGFNQESLSFEFKPTTGALIQGLEQEKNILLKGHFSEQLADSLAPLLLKRQNSTKEPLGQLILVSDNPSSFQYLPTNHHQVTENEKLDCLGLMDNSSKEKISPFLAQEPLSTLQARHDFWQHNPTSDSSEGVWDGMVHLNRAIPPLTKLNPQTSVAEAEAFTANRLQAVHAQLQHAPYVFLSGLSGVGKSTFVTKELSKHASFYEGKEAIEQWAQDSGDKQTILFLDEANLSAGNWSQFEGLFNNPPGILLDKTFYPLTKNHKVVFAGNPISYGDERKMSTLFQRHGNALVFEPLPTAVLYEDILKPVFVNTPLENKAARLSTYFLDVYAFLVDCSTTEVLISPRELQMMALMTVSFFQTITYIEPEVMAQHCARMFSKNSVPHTRRAEFDKRFQESLQHLAPKQDTNDKFLLTPSRYPIRHQLDALLKLREKRPQGTNDAQKYGGLGGIILEGEPGIGKSELVIKSLVANAYHEAHGKSEASNQLFYRMPVSWSVAEKESLLRRAFDEGAVVVIDEINSSPMIENILNHLLMGKTPEGNRPTNPGFMIIGTQNPTTMAGRRAPSTALSRRLITEILPNYTEQEMNNILVDKGVEEAKAKAMVIAFNHNVEHAQKNHLSPVPCFRDLFQLAHKESCLKPPRQEADRDQGIKPQLIEQIKTTMHYATTHYLNHPTNRADINYQHNYRDGFFSWARHGSKGRLNAQKFNDEIQSKEILNEAIDVIDVFLANENTC